LADACKHMIPEAENEICESTAMLLEGKCNFSSCEWWQVQLFIM